MINFKIDHEALKVMVKDVVKEVLQDFQPTENQQGENDLMTSKEAAKFLNLSRSTIYQKVSRMEISHFKRGNRLYFQKSELLKYIKKGRVKTVQDLQEEAKNFSPKK